MVENPEALMDANAQFLTMLGAVIVLFGLYAFARGRARDGSSAAGRFVSVVPDDSGRLFVPFVGAVLVVWAANFLTGGALSGPFDRFWVGLALGLTLGMLVAVLAMRTRPAQPKDRPR
jgi:hypothetical protein